MDEEEKRREGRRREGQGSNEASKNCTEIFGPSKLVESGVLVQ